MKVEQGNCRVLVIKGAPALDPITVFIENYAPGQGRMTVRVYDRAWTAAWFAMNGRTLEQFVATCDWDYVHGNLTQGLNGRVLKYVAKSDRDYLKRTILAIQGVFQQEILEKASRSAVSG